MTTRLDFMGYLSWWQGAMVAAIGAVLIWRWYRRDVARLGQRWARWMLPALRAAAMFAILATLTGPVLTHRVREGRPGRVLVFVDGSASMNVTDESMDAGRKLLIAVAQAGTTQPTIDLSLHQIAEALAACRRGLVADEDGAKRLVTKLETIAGQISRIDPAYMPEVNPVRGSITVEYHDGVPGQQLANLPLKDFFDQPATQTEERDSFESRPNRGDNYATRVRGYLYPPVSGTYIFWINSDDDSTLSLSTGADPAGRKLIARVDGFTPYHLWETMASQKSAPVELRAGQRYYIEALHKEGTGEDYVAVGWTRPDGRQERPIPSLYLSPWRAPALTGTQALARLREEFGKELLAPARQNASGRTPADQMTGLLAALNRWQQRFEDAFAAFAAKRLDSADAATRQTIADFNAATRWQRVEALALDPARGFLPGLLGTHELELSVLTGRSARGLWSSSAPGPPPTELSDRPQSAVTDLTDGVGAVESANTQRTAVVILTDGRHNDGAPPLELAGQLGARHVPMYLVGLGNHREPPDLAVMDVEAPQSVYTDDRVKGQLLLKDLMPAGSSVALTIGAQGREVWKHELTTTGEGLRRIDFDFAARDALSARTGGVQPDVQVLAAPVHLEARATVVTGETQTDNNTADLRFMVTSQGRRILLIDGRPRWETRFIRDLFARDRQWRLEPLIQDASARRAGWSTVDSRGQFPDNREALFAYGLIIFGELPRSTLAPEQLQWIRDFVEVRGGGLILIDGPRGYLREYERTPLGPLIPIAPADSFSQSPPDHLELTTPGRESAALRLERDAEINVALWRSLPRPHQVPRVRATEGSATLAEVVCADGSRLPALVQRRIGAGEVLYSAIDETWRWRFEVADQYQTRYWNQVATALMEAPFAVKDRYVAIDAGGPTLPAGESARLRVQLTDRNGQPLAKARAEVLVYHDGQKAGLAPLEEDAARPGLYRASTAPLEAGEYAFGVAIEGFSDLETPARAALAVVPRRQPEFAQLSCNEELLQAMAAASGGGYLREEEAGRLGELLKPLSEGKIVVTETKLAQSYWWFAPLLALLSVEWVVRKRVGLM